MESQPVLLSRLQGLIRAFFPFSLSPLLILMGIFYVNMVSRVSISPLLPVIKADLGLGLAEAGSLFLLLAVGYCSGLFLSGFATARLSHRRTILLSSGVMGIAMLGLSQTSSLTGMYVSLMIAGLSAGFYLPSGIALVTDLVPREHWGKGLALHELAPNLGFITAPLLVEGFLKLLRWRGALAFIGSWSIVIGLVFMVWGGGGKHKGEAPKLGAIRSVITQPVFWTMSVFFSFSIGASFAIYSMMPLYLVSEQGMGRELANLLTSISRSVGLLTLFLSGWVTDRAGHRRAMVLFLAATGAFVFLLGLVTDRGLTPLLLVLQAATAACAFPAGFSMLSDAFPLPMRNLAVSLVVMIGYLVGGGLFPFGIGYIAERSSFSWSFSILGLLTLGAVTLLVRVGPRGPDFG